MFPADQHPALNTQAACIIGQDTALKHRVRAYCSELILLKGNTHGMIKAAGFVQSMSRHKVGNAVLHTLYGNSDVVSIQMQLLFME